MRILLFFCITSVLFSARIQLQDQVLEVEIANTPYTRAKGLMGREELLEGTGMLFIYPRPEKLTFWMKNTLIPLSIAFFDEKKAILNILDMDPPKGDTLLTYESRSLAQYALEVPQGWFQKHKIKRGATFSFLD